MNIKRIFGALFTIIGAAALIYGSILFVNTTGTTSQVRGLMIFATLGFTFFFVGIGLVRTTSDHT